MALPAFTAAPVAHAPVPAAKAQWSIDSAEVITWVAGPLTRPELVGQPIERLACKHPQGDRTLRAHARALSGEPVSYDFDFDGATLLRVHLSPIYADHQTVGVFGTAMERAAERGAHAFAEAFRLAGRPSAEPLRGIFQVTRPLAGSRLGRDDALIVSPEAQYPQNRIYGILQVGPDEARAYLEDSGSCQFIHANHAACPQTIRALLARTLAPRPAIRLLRH